MDRWRMSQDLKDGWNLIWCRFSIMHTFFLRRTFWCAPKCTMLWPRVFIYFSFFFFLRLGLLSYIFFFAVVVVAAVLSLVQKWDAFVSQGENKEKRYQLARQSAKRRTASNKSNSNNNMLVWIFVYYTYM